MEAIRAAKLVQVKYKDMQTPVLTIKDALNFPDRIIDHARFGPVNVFDVGNVEGIPTTNIIYLKKWSKFYFFVLQRGI